MKVMLTRKLISRVRNILRSLSGVFLVQDDHWHPDIQSVLGKDRLQLIRKTLQEQFSFGSFLLNFDKKLMDTTTEIIKVKTFTPKKIMNIADCYIESEATKYIALGCTD